VRQTQKYKKIRVLSFSNLLFFIAYAAYPTVQHHRPISAERRHAKLERKREGRLNAEKRKQVEVFFMLLISQYLHKDNNTHFFCDSSGGRERVLFQPGATHNKACCTVLE
jgi:hypothetical protein